MLEHNDPLVAEAVARIQARRPLRAWSLIVTIYGDAIGPRGGSLWLGSLLDMMAAFGIGGGVVRTAMSRLAKDGWITRQRIGRQSYYRLSPKGAVEFAAAAEHIYAAGPPAWDGRWTVALLAEDSGPARRARRETLLRRGYAAFAPNVLLRPAPANGDATGDPALLTLRAESGDGDEARRLAAQLWPIETLTAGYRRFLAAFAAVDQALGHSPADARGAFVLRIALVHEYRRLVLHDPALPADLLPEDWPGTAARALARDIYGKLLAPSERWLDAHAMNEDGPLPPPERGLYRRFGGLAAKGD